MLKKILKRSLKDIRIIGNTLSSLLTLSRTNIKNDLFVPDFIYASSISRFRVLLVKVAVHLLVSF